MTVARDVLKQTGVLKKWKKKKLRLLHEQLVLLHFVFLIAFHLFYYLILYNIFSNLSIKIYLDDPPAASGKIRAMALAGCKVELAYPNLNVEPSSKDAGKIKKLLAFKVDKYINYSK